MAVSSDPLPSPTASGRTAAAMLARSAPVFQTGLVVLGLATTAGLLGTLGPAPGLSATLLAIGSFGGFVLAGWIGRRLVVALAEAMEHLATLAEATARLAAGGERPVAPGPLLSSPGSPANSSGEAALRVETEQSRNLGLAEIRVALRQSQWTLVETLIQSFSDRFPDDPATAHLNNELTAAKQAAVTTLRTKIEAAQQANDPERILEIHAEMNPLLGSDELLASNRRLARWFMHQIQKRLRQGVMTAELALLAARVAEAFDTTAEGASLRAALPTLRRSAGLCARCGQPYTGLADACPACHAAGSLSASVAAHPHPSNNGGHPPPDDGEEVDLNPREPETD